MLLLQVLSLRSRPMTWLVCWSLSARLKSHGKLLKDEVTSENLSPISGCAQLLEKVFFDFYRIHLIHFNPSLIVFDQFHHPPVKKKWSCTEGNSSHHEHENGFFLPLGSIYEIARSLPQLSILKTDSRQRSPESESGSAQWSQRAERHLRPVHRSLPVYRKILRR